MQSAPTRRATTSDSYERCVRDHVLPHLGEVRLRELTPERIRNWQTLLLQKPRRFRDGPLSPTTVRYCHRLLRRALQDALRWELIDRNPCDAVVAPRAAETEMQVWTPAEVQQLPRSRGRAIGCARCGACSSSPGCDVARSPGCGGSTSISTPAASPCVTRGCSCTTGRRSRNRRRHDRDESSRSMPATVEALTRHRQRQDEERLEFGEAWTDTGYVFAREDGEPLDPDRISHLFGLAAAAQACRGSVCTTSATRPRLWRWRPACTRRSCPNVSVTRRSRSRSTSTAISSPECRRMPPRRSRARSTYRTRATSDLRADLRTTSYVVAQLPAQRRRMSRRRDRARLSPVQIRPGGSRARTSHLHRPRDRRTARHLPIERVPMRPPGRDPGVGARPASCRCSSRARSAA